MTQALTRKYSAAKPILIKEKIRPKRLRGGRGAPDQEFRAHPAVITIERISGSMSGEALPGVSGLLRSPEQAKIIRDECGKRENGKTI